MTMTTTTVRKLSDQNPDGTQFGNSATDLIGFWGAAPVAQNGAPGGLTGTVAAGATTSVFVNTTFSGGTGSTAYTVADVVLVLKTMGILKL